MAEVEVADGPQDRRSLRAEIRKADQQERAARRAAQAAYAAAAAPPLSSLTLRPETPDEKRVRLARRQAEQARDKAFRRDHPDQHFVDQHVSTEAQQHGLYRPDTVPGPTIIKNGKEKPTSIAVVRNRGGTTVERWLAAGAIDKRQAEAIAFYCRMWTLFHGAQRVTANWSLVATFRGGTTDFDAFARTQLHAKRMLAWLDDEVFFSVGFQKFAIWQNVVLFDEPAGVAGGRLGFKSKQAEAAAKVIVLLLADMVADALNLGQQRPPEEWLERA